MHARYLLLLVLMLLLSCSAPPEAPPDWLVTPFSNPVEVEYHADQATLVLTNGLIRRTFRTAPNAATVGYDNLITETPVIRAVKPEARLQIDGVWYDVGGLEGQPDHAYLTPEWLEGMTANPEAFQFKDYAVGPLTPHLVWARKRYAANTTWPPPGKTLSLTFEPPDALRPRYAGLRVVVHYQENPIFMHVRHSDAESVRRAIDQSAEVGFEMVIITFGSGFDMENEDPAYIAEIKGFVDYAHSKGVELGGYSLFSSRRISDEHDVINPEKGQPGGAIFGNAPCLGSRWGADYIRKLTTFIEQTGLDVLEHDGPYPGDVCASTQHPGHTRLADSQWRQWTITTDFYAWNLARGVYLNVPDFYFLNGSTKVAMGYRETNWSLPRHQQLIHARQNIYDGTWEKTPSMGWMFVPLVEYHGGGEAATLEPLAEHLRDYEAHLANLFGAGVMAAYRGPRLYDSDSTRAVVKKWVDFYKRYRAILDSDVIHLRRADGQDIDGLLHVNPQVQHKGLAVLYNPTDRTLSKILKLPLYYTGLTKTARIREQEGKVQTYKLDRAYNAYVPLTMEPHSVTWFVME